MRAVLIAALLAGAGCGGGDNTHAVDAAPVGGRRFHPTQRIGNKTSADPPRIALDSRGVGFAVWTQWADRGASVWAARFVPATGWGPPELLETHWPHADSPEIAVDEQGRAAVVWQQTDGIQRFDIWGTWWTAAGGWDIPVLLESDGFGAGDVHMAMAPGGAAVAAFAQSSGGALSIWGLTAPPGGRWSAPVLLETDAGAAGAPAVAIDAGGRAVVVWQQVIDGVSDVRSASWDGSSWGPALTLDTATAAAVSPGVALAVGADAAAVWQAGGGVWLNRGAPPMPMRIESTGDAVRPQVALDGSAAWVAFEWSQGPLLGATLVRNGSTPIDLSAGARFPAFSVARGRALVAWQAHGVRAGWDGASELLTAEPSARPSVAIGGDVAIVAWAEPTGIFAARAR